MFDFLKFNAFSSRLKKSMDTYHKLDDPWSAAGQLDAIDAALEVLLPPCGSVLEVGAGDGLVSQLLLKRCKRLTAVELSAAAVGKLERSFGDERSRVKVVQKDIHRYHFVEEYDAIVLSFVISYLGFAKFPKRFVQLLYRLTGKTKRLVIVQPINEPADEQTMLHIKVILERMGFLVEKQFLNEDTHPTLLCAVFRGA